MRRIATGLVSFALAWAFQTPASFAQTAGDAFSNCKYYMKILQDFAAGVPFCEQCLKDQPDNPEARFLAGWCFSETGRYAEAYEAYAPLLSRLEDPDKDVRKHAKASAERADQTWRTLFDSGTKLMAAGNNEEAVKVLTNATLMNPKKADAFMNLGYAQSQLKNVDGAIDAYRKALAAKPDDHDANKYLTVPLTTKLESLTAASPPDSAAIASVRSELVSALEKVVPNETDPATLATATAQLGSLLMASGDREKGLAHLKKAAELDPSNAAMLYNAGVDLLNGEKYADAAIIFQMVSETVTDPTAEIWPDTMYNLAFAHFNAGDYAKSIEAGEKLVAQKPGEKDYYNLLANAYLKKGDTAKAMEYNKKFTEAQQGGAK